MYGCKVSRKPKSGDAERDNAKSVSGGSYLQQALFLVTLLLCLLLELLWRDFHTVEMPLAVVFAPNPCFRCGRLRAPIPHARHVLGRVGCGAALITCCDSWWLRDRRRRRGEDRQGDWQREDRARSPVYFVLGGGRKESKV